jgi:predicted RNase H-like HicB family nuclease
MKLRDHFIVWPCVFTGMLAFCDLVCVWSLNVGIYMVPFGFAFLVAFWESFSRWWDSRTKQPGRVDQSSDWSFELFNLVGQYSYIGRWSYEDKNVFVVHVDEWPSVQGFGADHDEAMTECRIALGEHIQECRQFGSEFPLPAEFDFEETLCEYVDVLNECGGPPSQEARFFQRAHGRSKELVELMNEADSVWEEMNNE